MKNMKKLTALVLALTMVFSMLMVARAAEERMPSEVCPDCGGTVYTSTQERVIATYTVPCEHGTTSTDTYKTYQIYERHKCNSCSYVGTYNLYTEDRFYKCNG